MSDSDENDAKLYLKATQEFEAGDVDDALWAKALTLASGNKENAKYEYVKFRVLDLVRGNQGDAQTETRVSSSRVPSSGSLEQENLKKKTHHKGSNESAEDREAGKLPTLLVNGDLGLARTYWLYGVVVNLLLGLAITAFSETGQQAGFFLLSVLSLIYGSFVLVGIWRASNKYEGPKFWSVLAKIATLLGWMQITAGAITLGSVV